MKKNKFLALLFAALLSGCASIVGSSSENVTVSSNVNSVDIVIKESIG